jgi:esterase/lipase superfamily enzyme
MKILVKSRRCVQKKWQPRLLQYQQLGDSSIACSEPQTQRRPLSQQGSLLQQRVGLPPDQTGEFATERTNMVREYRNDYSSSLGREMELLIFGHAGLPVVVFPTSCGHFFEFEDRGVVDALAPRIDAGQLQLICLDSVDMESWYNQDIPPRERIARHMQYEDYVLSEIVPLVRGKNPDPRLTALGCSFGGYHAVNIALRHPDVFTGLLSLSGAFDLSSFLRGYYDQDCYYHLPTHYLPNLTDPWFLDRYRRSNYVLATGWDDHCLVQNQNLDWIMSKAGIPHELHIWDSQNSHDWPTWQRMVQEYL